MLLWCQVQVKIQKRETNVELQGPAAAAKIQKPQNPTRYQFVVQFLQAPHHHFETHQSLNISAGWYDGPDAGPIYRVYWTSWTKCSNGVKYKSRYKREKQTLSCKGPPPPWFQQGINMQTSLKCATARPSAIDSEGPSSIIKSPNIRCFVAKPFLSRFTRSLGIEFPYFLWIDKIF